LRKIGAIIEKVEISTHKICNSFLVPFFLKNFQIHKCITFSIFPLFVYCIQGSGGKAIKILFEWIHSPPTKIMLIGPATTTALEPVAESVLNWNLLEVKLVLGQEYYVYGNANLIS
jgi:hypothetical protein